MAEPEQHGHADAGSGRAGMGVGPGGAGTAVAGSAGEALGQVVTGLQDGAGLQAFRTGIEAGQRVLGNRAFLRWMEALGVGAMRGVCGPIRTDAALPAPDCGPLQLMGKKKKQQQGAARTGSSDGTQGHTGAGTTANRGAAAEGEEKPEAGVLLPQPGAQAAALPVEKKKKKSRVQVALNTLRSEGVAVFGSYVEAEIGESALLGTLVERITRAEDLRSVRAEALAVVEARRRLLDPGGATGAPGRQEPELAVIAPVKSEFTRRERELLDSCMKGDIGKLRRYLRHGIVDINMGSQFGTLLCVAAYMGHTGIVKELLSVPGIDINLAGQDGITPLCSAAQAGHAKVVELLLAERGINVNLATISGATPLYVAAQNGDVEVVRLLLAAPGINVNPVRSEIEATPLECAIYMGYEDVAGLLLAAPGIEINRCTAVGPSALFIACQFGYLGIVEQLVRHGAAVNPASPEGTTPLYAAINSGNVQLIRILLTAQDTRINQATGDGIVPLGFAVSRGHKDIVELLLRHGADPNTQGDAGLTSLHVACLYGHTAIVRILLHGGADADAEAKVPFRGGLIRTPANLAELGGHREVMSILAALPRPERLSVTGEPGKPVLPPASPEALSPPGAGAAGQATTRVCPLPPTPSPPAEAAPVQEPPTPLAQAKHALRLAVLGKLRADNFDTLEGIRLLEDVNDSTDLDGLCSLYNRQAHIERIKERARRSKRRRGLLSVPAGPGPAAADPAAAPVFALGGQAGLDADHVEVEIKRHLGQAYQRFVSQAVNDMEFGRGKGTTGYPGLWHVSAGVAGVGSCSVFYYLDAERNRIRVVGIGHHVGRAAYRLDYAAEELGEAGRVLRIA